MKGDKRKMTRERFAREFKKHNKDNEDCYDPQLWLAEVEKENAEQKKNYKDMLVDLYFNRKRR